MQLFWPLRWDSKNPLEKQNPCLWYDTQVSNKLRKEREMLFPGRYIKQQCTEVSKAYKRKRYTLKFPQNSSLYIEYILSAFKITQYTQCLSTSLPKEKYVKWARNSWCCPGTAASKILPKKWVLCFFHNHPDTTLREEEVFHFSVTPQLFESIQCLLRHEEAGSCGNLSFFEFRFQGMGWITTRILAQRRCRPQHANKNTNSSVLPFSTHWQWLRSGLWRSSAICTLTVHPEIGIGKKNF